jgi:hypothetical protein
MPYRKIIAIFFLVSTAGCASSSDSLEEVAIDDGRPLGVRGDGISLDFDGANSVRVSSGERQFSIGARSPATAFFSPDKRFLAFNFGNGSGQVYDLDIYELKTGRKYNLASLKSSLTRTAAAQGCRAASDAVSVLFDRWTGNNGYTVRTEDFSRSPGCSSLAGEWKMKLENPGQ